MLEIALVYFIMPLPGSQAMRSIDTAYFLYSWRWPLRVAILALVLATAWPAWRRAGAWRRWLFPASLIVAGVVAYAVNFRMSADRMFVQPRSLLMQPLAQSNVAREVRESAFG